MRKNNSKTGEKKNKKAPSLTALIIGAFFLALVVGSGLWISINSQLKDTDADPHGLQTSISIGGPFALTDDNGKAVTHKDYAGKFLLVYFGFTHCPDICPVGLQTIASALEMTGYNAPRVQPLFITLDPTRDTPEVLKKYLESFHSRIIGLTGDEDEVKKIAAAYKVLAEKSAEQGADNYTVNHSGFIYLMGPDGKFITMYKHDTGPKQLAGELRNYLRDRDGKLN